jgi:ParB family chromosome partitioning protein
MGLNFGYGAVAATLRGETATPETAPTGGKIEDGALWLREDVLDPNPFPHRSGKTAEEYEKVEASILALGQQTPILVRKHPTEAGRYQICCGQTRTEIIRRNELIWVKTQIADLSDSQMIELAFSENFSRNDLNQLDIVDGLLAIMETRGVARSAAPAIAAALSRRPAEGAEAQTVAEVLATHGVSVSQFRRWLEVLRKPEDVLAAIRGGLPFSVGLLISRVPDEADRANLIAQAKAGELSARGIQDWINAQKAPPKPKGGAASTAERLRETAKFVSTTQNQKLLYDVEVLLKQIESRIAADTEF